MAAKHTSCATSSAERPLRSADPSLARQYRTTIGRMVSSTSRSASRLPATASATTASRRSPEIVIGAISPALRTGHFPREREVPPPAGAQLNTNDPNKACRLSAAHTTAAAATHGIGALIDEDSATCAAECVEQPISASKHANAHRNGISPSCPVASSARLGDARGTAPTSPALHSAAARMTSDLTRCRAEPSVAADSTARSACPTAATPSPRAIASSAVTHASRTGSRAGTSRRRPRPRAPGTAQTPRTGPRPVRRRPDRSTRPRRLRGPRPPAPTRCRLSVRARVCQPSWRRNDACVLCASEASGPAC